MENKVLLVVDMQKDFIKGSLGTEEAKAIVPKVIEKIKSWDGDIVATQDTHYANYLDTDEGKKLPIVHCIKNTDGWRLPKGVYKALVSGDNTYFYEKHYFSEFEMENGIWNIGEKEYEYVEIVGLCTDICVISNALMLKSAWHDSRIVVDASCCAGTTPEMHQKALDVMKSCQIEIING